MIPDHYTVRPLKIEDGPQLLALITRNKLRISDYLPKTAETISDLPATDAYIKQKLKETARKEHYCMVIEDTIAQQPTGLFFIKNIDWNIPKCELGYFVDEAHAGKGVATGAMAEVVRFCFDTLEIRKIFLRTGIDNVASRKAAEKNGFALEGILRKDFKLQNGTLVDLAYYGRINETGL